MEETVALSHSESPKVALRSWDERERRSMIGFHEELPIRSAVRSIASCESLLERRDIIISRGRGRERGDERNDLPTCALMLSST
jgi:hypothetical protein